MATTLTKTVPISGLCKFCSNRVSTKRYKPSEDEDEGVAMFSCSAIPNFIFSNEQNPLIGSTGNDENLTMTVLDSIISNCNRYLPAANLVLDDVSYDAGTTTLTVYYTVEGAIGTPDVLFYLVGRGSEIYLLNPGGGDGNYSQAITIALADGTYYLYIRLSTGENSNILPFTLATT